MCGWMDRISGRGFLLNRNNTEEPFYPCDCIGCSDINSFRKNEDWKLHSSSNIFFRGAGVGIGRCVLVCERS